VCIGCHALGWREDRGCVGRVLVGGHVRDKDQAICGMLWPCAILFLATVDVAGRPRKHRHFARSLP
jgi:hypothetical protein